jgi:very-short-patch-repair endonuclease
VPEGRGGLYWGCTGGRGLLLRPAKYMGPIIYFSPMGQVHNKASLTPVRKQLRTQGTSAEALLWLALKNKQLQGRKFRRQHSINSYIVDFYCATERLVIELDGANHYTVSGNMNDEERDAYLNAIDIKVLRFENRLVREHLDSVLQEIAENFKQV